MPTIPQGSPASPDMTSGTAGLDPACDLAWQFGGNPYRSWTRINTIAASPPRLNRGELVGVKESQPCLVLAYETARGLPCGCGANRVHLRGQGACTWPASPSARAVGCHISPGPVGLSQHHR